MTKFAERIPQVIQDWSEIARDVLIEAGLSKDQSVELGLKIVTRISDENAGQQFYLPIWLARRISDRDRKIANAAASGVPIESLAFQHNLHMTTIYAILRRVAHVDIDSRQARMFDDDGGAE